MYTEPALVPTKYHEEKGDQVSTLGLWGMVETYTIISRYIIIVITQQNKYLSIQLLTWQVEL